MKKTYVVISDRKDTDGNHQFVNNSDGMLMLASYRAEIFLTKSSARKFASSAKQNADFCSAYGEKFSKLLVRTYSLSIS